MVSNEYPYAECNSAAGIWKKVSAGGKPEVLTRIKHLPTRQFLQWCIAPAKFRPRVEDVLRHPYLVIDRTGSDDMYVNVAPSPAAAAEAKEEADKKAAAAAEAARKAEEEKTKVKEAFIAQLNAKAAADAAIAAQAQVAQHHPNGPSLTVDVTYPVVAPRPKSGFHMPATPNQQNQNGSDADGGFGTSGNGQITNPSPPSSVASPNTPLSPPEGDPNVAGSGADDTTGPVRIHHPGGSMVRPKYNKSDDAPPVPTPSPPEHDSEPPVGPATPSVPAPREPTSLVQTIFAAAESANANLVCWM